MDFLKRFAQGELGLGRIEAFSDGNCGYGANGRLKHPRQRTWQ